MTREDAIEYWEGLRKTFSSQLEKEENHFGRMHLQTTIDALDMAISALRQQDVADKDVGKWISVKDRLPDYMGEVLVIVSGKPHENITLDGAYEIAEYDPVEGWILEMWPEWCSGVVTHWMPLPEPPEEDEAK